MARDDQVPAGHRTPDPGPKRKGDAVGTSYTVPRQLLSALLSPAAVTAAVTALLGSVAVNGVSKSLGERELQFKVIESLMSYTQQAPLDDSVGIMKLSAMVELVRGNPQFDVEVGGFAKIVEAFHENELATKEQEIRRLRAVEDSLRRLATSPAVRGEDRERLEQRIANVRTELRSAAEAREQIAAERDRLLTASDSLIRQLRQRADSLSRAVQPERVTLEWRQDSVDVIQDGQAGATEWAFRFDAAGQQGAHRVRLSDNDVVVGLGAPTVRFTVTEGDDFELSILGEQTGDAQWKARGTRSVNWPRLDGLSSLVLVLPVAVAGERSKGSFYFFSSLRRVVP